MMKAKKLSEEELRKIVGGTSSESFSPFVSFFGKWDNRSFIDRLKQYLRSKKHRR